MTLMSFVAASAGVLYEYLYCLHSPGGMRRPPPEFRRRRAACSSHSG